MRAVDLTIFKHESKSDLKIRLSEIFQSFKVNRSAFHELDADVTDVGMGMSYRGVIR